MSTAVLTRLANLASCDGSNKSKTMKASHPDHCKALEDANLSPKHERSPTLDYLKKCVLRRQDLQKKKKQNDMLQENGGVYFCISYSAFWERSLHQVLKVLIDTWSALAEDFDVMPSLSQHA
jgi:hypothetical protein